MTVPQSLYQQTRYFGLAQKLWAVPSGIQYPVQGHTGLAGGELSGRKNAARRQTAVEAEGDEQRLAHEIPVREAAIISVHLI